MAVHAEVAPAILFLVFYSAFFILLTTLYATKRISWKSRWSFIYFHVCLRVIGMSLGVVFSCMEWRDDGGPRVDVLVGYLVFSAEGYFSLILCAYRFLVVWQQDRFGTSYLEPRVPKGTPKKEQWKMHLRAPLATLHWALLVANAFIITGSSIMAGGIGDELTPSLEKKQNKGKNLRLAGTAIFLAAVQAFLLLCVHAFRQKRDRTLSLIALTWPFLTVRGVYGLMSVIMDQYSYGNMDVYTDSGFTSTFLVGEHVMGTAMEWIACGLLISTFFSRVVGGEEMVEQWTASEVEEEKVKMKEQV
ncbi:hypothetical protein JCM11251_001837 [Rhodosporidiobolus azoricus]